MSVTVSIVNTFAVQGFNILDNTNYSGAQSIFNYIKINITDPNGNIVSYGNNVVDNTISPPSNFSGQPSYSFPNYTQAGAYSVQYIILQQLPNNLGSGVWTSGYTVFWNGNYYQCIVSSFSFSPGTTASIIAAALTAGNIIVVQEANLNGSFTIPGLGFVVNYIATLSFAFWSSLLTCLLDKLSKYNCKVTTQKSVTIKCDDEDLDTILQLNYIYQYLIYNTLDPTDPAQLKTINIFSNYINTVCNCKNCKC
jgi:hypothetical protein